MKKWKREPFIISIIY